MGLKKLIANGFFSILWDFSDPGKSAAAWAAFAIGLLVQIVINMKAKRPESRFFFAAAVVVLMILCEFTQYGKILPDDPTVLYYYGLLVCTLIGLAIPAIVLWIKNKKGASGSAPKASSDDKKG